MVTSKIEGNPWLLAAAAVSPSCPVSVSAPVSVSGSEHVSVTESVPVLASEAIFAAAAATAANYFVVTGRNSLVGNTEEQPVLILLHHSAAVASLAASVAVATGAQGRRRASRNPLTKPYKTQNQSNSLSADPGNCPSGCSAKIS